MTVCQCGCVEGGRQPNSATNFTGIIYISIDTEHGRALRCESESESDGGHHGVVVSVQCV